MSKPLILITNDDGVRARGINELAQEMRKLGDVVIVAPDLSSSGMSSAITVKNPIRLGLVSSEPGLKIYRCSGTPVDCVKIALNQVLETAPDIVLSGINHGINTSISVHYSGTMGAAIEGAIHGYQSIGFSLNDYNGNANFATSLPIIRQIVSNVLEKPLPKGVCLNVNIPDTTAINGVKICRQADGKWIETFEKRHDPLKKTYYWLSGYFKDHEPTSQDTDEWAIKNNFISIVPCLVDLTAYTLIEELKSRNYALE